MPNREGQGFRAPALSYVLNYALKASKRLPKNCYHLKRTRPESDAGDVYFTHSTTGALVGVQPFGGFGFSGTETKADGPDYLPLHMLPRTVVERF